MACSTVGKCILLPINSLFMVIGLAFTAVGVILTFVPDILFDKLYDTVKENLENQLQIGQIKLPENADGLKDLPFLSELGIALIVIGVFLFVVSFFGFCGACCTTCCRCLLILFAVMLLVMMAAEIATGAMFLVTDSPLHDNLHSQLKEKITNEFNETSGDAFSAVIIFISKEFDCCGIDGKTDFGNKSIHFCDYDSGCYVQLTDAIEDNVIWAGLILAAILLLQLLEAIFAIVIFKGANKVSPI